MKINKNHARKLLINAFVSIIIGIIIAGIIASIQYLKIGDEKGNQYSIGIENAQVQNLEKNEAGYVFGKNVENVISWELDGKYVNKFEYSYNTDNYIEGYVDVYTNDSYGNPSQEQIKDTMIPGMHRSVVNVGGNVTRIEVHYSNSEVNAAISDAIVDNQFKFNPYIALFVVAGCFLILFFIRLKEVYYGHVERAFLVCSLVIGGFLVLSSPAYTVGWDEEIHFRRAYEMGNLGIEGSSEQTAEYILTTHSMYKLSSPYQTLEERFDSIQYMNSLTGQASSFPIYYTFGKYWIKFIAYIPQAIIFGVGELIHAPFYFLWLLGKAIYLIIYSVIIFFAIKKIPIAKHLTAVVALVPTAIFQATVYTYDSAVIACAIYAVAVIVKGLINREQKLSKMEMMCFFAAMIVACLSKAVYAPLFFVALFIPEKAYESKKECRVFRGMLIGLFLAVMACMLLPTLTNPSAEGDSRGGATSVSGQLSYVLGHPFAYAYIMLSSIAKSFMSYFLGDQGLCILGHYGTAQYDVDMLLAIFIIFVTITDVYNRHGGMTNHKEDRLTWKARGIFFIALALIIAFIWTAIYLSFTEVGKQYILGVQGRYYIPILLPSLLLLQGSWLQNTMDEGNYQQITLGGISIITMYVILSVIVIPSCM